MSAVAILGWALFGGTALVALAMVLRTSGLKADLAMSEGDRERLEQDLRDTSRDYADRNDRLEAQIRSMREDLAATRAELEETYQRVPGMAPERLDSAIERASRILSDLGRSEP